MEPNIVTFKQTPQGDLKMHIFAPEQHGAKTRLVRPGLPPMIVMQGDKDEITPLEPCREFCSKMVAVGNECKLLVYAGEGHGFINYQAEGNPRFEETLRDMDSFLVEHGFLEGEPTV